MSYSDLSLMGSCSSNNNSISHVDHFGVYDSALAAASFAHCFGSASADGAPSLLQMLHPGSFVHDVGLIGDAPADSASVEMLYGSAFAADLASNGYMVNNVFSQAEMEMPKLGRKRRKGGSGKEVEEGGSNKNEKKRRERLSMKYQVLKQLLPNSTKDDRATIIADSMDYINELLRSLNELKMLVDKKRRRRDGMRKLDMGTDIDIIAGDTESSCLNPLQNAKGSLLRSSWLQRRSKETNVDVRIVEDEVFIKLTQRKRLDCLLVISRVLDELSLDLLHLSGGNMGDSHIFMINAKIHEGSSVYACAIAKKMIESMEAEYPHYP